MNPIKFKEYNKIYSKNQPPYIPLPAYEDDMQGGRIIHCWQLGWRERFKLFITGKLWVYVLNFKQKPQPIKPMVDNPFSEKKK